MRFVSGDQSCDTEVFKNEKDIVVRFYNKAAEPEESDIIDFVEVDTGFGYLALKFKGEEALLSGFLDENFFKSQTSIESAIDFVKNLNQMAWEAYIPYRICMVRCCESIEYNGETR